MDAKKYLIEILDYYKNRLQNDTCTMEEINSAAKALESNMEIHGTISDFANFYVVSESNVRANIARKLFAKPKRVLLYLIGDITHEISDIVCELSCPHCNSRHG